MYPGLPVDGPAATGDPRTDGEDHAAECTRASVCTVEVGVTMEDADKKGCTVWWKMFVKALAALQRTWYSGSEQLVQGGVM